MKRRERLMDGGGQELKQPQALLVCCTHHKFHLDNKRAEEQTDRKAKQLSYQQPRVDVKANLFCKGLPTGERLYAE